VAKKSKTKNRGDGASPRNIVHVDKAFGAMQFGERHHDEGERPPVATTHRPAQLPATSQVFHGRADELSAAVSLLGGIRSAGGAIAFSGPPGVGKTALAVRLAHKLIPSYPDAQLYVDLGEIGSERDDLEQILERLLRALGFSGEQISASYEEKIGQYRSALTGRRCLLVLDNAIAEDQVRTLLPGSQGIATLITSRNSLSGLAGVKRLRLDTLSQEDSVKILEEVAGKDRISTEPVEARKITELCGGLPLALQIAANRLKDRPAWALSYFAGRLQDKRRVLQSLQAGDLAVRASFSLSYEGLNDTEKMVFRRFGASPSSGTSAALMAFLCDCSEYEAEGFLEQLCDASLLQPSRIEGRYRAHDLIRAFSQECLREEEGEAAAKEIAVNAISWYAIMVRDASQAMYEGEGVAENYFDSPQAATDWTEQELTALTECITVAYDEGFDDHLCIGVCSGLTLFFERRNHIRLWLQVASYGVLAARRAECKSCLIGALLDMYRASSFVSPNQDAPVGYLDEAYRLAQDLGSRKNESYVLYRIGLAAAKRSRGEEAEKIILHALSLAKSANEVHQQGKCFNSLGDICLRRGDFELAAEYYGKARVCFLSQRDRHCQGLSLCRMARLQLVLSDYNESRAASRSALKLFQAVHDLHCMGMAHGDLATAAAAIGDLEEAKEAYAAACSCFERVNDGYCWASSLESSAEIDDLCGREDEARVKRDLAVELRSSSEGVVFHASDFPVVEEAP
jgi:tetratricopeptide (TPR) repeat protein